MLLLLLIRICAAKPRRGLRPVTAVTRRAVDRTAQCRGGGESLWQAYSRTLEARPVAGNMITGGLLALTGDTIMQIHEGNDAYDPLRALRFVGFRVCVARGYTIWVRELEQWVNQRVDKGRVLTKTVLDLGIWLPAKDFVYFVWMALLEGMSLAEGVTRSLTMLPRTCPVSWAVWGPAQLLNFSVVPLHLRVVWCNSFALFWNVVMSGFNQAARAESS